MIVTALGGLAVLLAAAAEAAGPAPDEAAVRRFLEAHWKRPLSPQGPAPSGFTRVEASLAPESCGTCHPAQWADWRQSLHARSMGPGLTGQLIELWRTDPDSARLCLTCHAPLAEQQPENRAIFDASLQRQGLVCAACHVRGHQRFGPPRRDGTLGGGPGRATPPHRGATGTPAFARSAFCASCHQFEPDGFALNGKLLENTYNEWKASPAARRGMQCQGCHMPDRRHLWRGIHDPELTRAGVDIKVTLDRPRYRVGDRVTARVSVANTNVGHHFPTYVTPRIVVRAELTDGSGAALAGSVEERAIARDVALDLSRELADTRVPAGGRFVLDYRRRLPAPGLRLRVTITVYPDHFYTRFFESLLAGGAGAGEADIRAALDASRRSSFELYRREIPLT